MQAGASPGKRGHTVSAPVASPARRYPQLTIAVGAYLSEGYAVADASHPQADTMVKSLNVLGPKSRAAGSHPTRACTAAWLATGSLAQPSGATRCPGLGFRYAFNR
jgi:hypothetical protein